MYVAEHWKLAWIGLDAGQVVALLLTAWAAQRRRMILVIVAPLAATLFVVDAWFDVTTARSGDLLQSVLLALVIEIPAAIIMMWVGIATLRRVINVPHEFRGSRAIVALFRTELPEISESRSEADTFD
jgi:hypothetical protein